MLLSSEILKFNVRFSHLVEFFPANRNRFGYTDIQMQKLHDLWEEWKEVYIKYTHPLFNGGIMVTNQMNSCYDRSYEFINIMRKRSVGPTEKITTEDNAYLELNTNTKTQGKVRVTDYAPCLALLEQTRELLKFYALDKKRLNSKEKPEGADNIGIMSAYKSTGEPAPTLEEYKKITSEKKSIFEFPVSADKSGMDLYIIVYYISPTGEAGKPSIPMMVKLM